MPIVVVLPVPFTPTTSTTAGRASSREPRGLLRRRQLGEHFTQPFDDVVVRLRAAALEPLDHLLGRRDADVCRDQHVLERLPRLEIGGVVAPAGQSARDRPPALREAGAQSPQATRPFAPRAPRLLRPAPRRRGASAQVRVTPRRPRRRCLRRSRFETTWETPSDAHRHAVEDIGGLHRPFLMGDDDELRPVRVATQQIDEATDVRVVERRLDLVEEIDGARPREEEGEQERQRAERLLAPREQREPRHLLAGGPQLDLDARLLPSSSLSGSVSRSLPSPPGKRVAGDIGEVTLDSGVGLLEAPLDRLGQLRAGADRARRAIARDPPAARSARQPPPSRARAPRRRAG